MRVCMPAYTHVTYVYAMYVHALIASRTKMYRGS